MSILNLTSEELVKHVENEFKEVKDSDFENGDNAYHQKNYYSTLGSDSDYIRASYS